MIMSFQLSDTHKTIRKAVREFGENEIRPVAREYDEKRKYPADIVAQAAEYDFVAPHIRGEYGGADMDTLSKTIIVEEVWRADPGIGSAISSAGFGTEMIQEYGDERVKERWLPKIAAGEAISSSGISEPDHGSDVAGIETRAERDGDEWVLNGNKMWITNGTVADICLLAAKTDPGEGHRGISMFLVPTSSDGFTARAIDNKLGIRASDLGELYLEDVRIPEENLVGEENRGSIS